MTVQRQAQFGVALMSASTPAGCMARTRSEGPQSALHGIFKYEFTYPQYFSIVAQHTQERIRCGGQKP